MRKECGKVRLVLRGTPGCQAECARAAHLTRQARGYANGFLVVAASHADEAGLEGVVVVIVLAQVVEESTELLRDELFVRESPDRRTRVRASLRAARRHHDPLIPEEKCLRLAQIVHLRQELLQPFELVAHAGTLSDAVRPPRSQG